MKEKILVADDSQAFLVSLTLLLKRFGYGVMPGESGLEVLKLARFAKPDLVILDVNMERMDGITVLRHLKNDTETFSIPVIMLSSDSNSATVEKCRELGCAAYLFKPIKIDELHRAVQSCFYSITGTNRMYLRCAFKTRVTVTCSGHSHELYSDTLSVGGIYLRMKDPLPVGSSLEMTLSLRKGTQLALKGDVIYTKDLFGEMLPGMAVQFKELSAGDHELLNNFIEGILAGDILENSEEAKIAPVNRRLGRDGYIFV
jgi:CheY-like chemotaxis protein